ncbi:MAG: aminoacyl-histidine dipeptidase [Bacteroidales bacterium]
MSDELNDLEPKSLWGIFDEMTQIPRPSKHEDKIQEWAVNFGEKLGLETLKDDVGNVIIKKPATSGMEDRKGVILQGHLDMVPQKNSSTRHDFLKDPIKTFIEGDWVKAKGTTLGADNGIGVAATLAVLASKDIPHPYIEALLTADEETGMTGANGLQPGILDGDILINMDSEDEGELYIGCAGGVNTNARMHYDTEELPPNTLPYKISVTGLKGGHSGLDIHLGRGNANKIMNELLTDVSEKFGVRLACIEGGSLRNAIPRESFAVVMVPEANKERFKAYVQTFEEKAKEAFREADPGLIVQADRTKMPRNIIEKKVQDNLYQAVRNCPNGVVSMSRDMPGVVETSTNLAVVKSGNGVIEFATLQRSQVDKDKEELSAKTEKAFRDAGAKPEISGNYPGWQPDVHSAILKEMKEIYNQRFGKVPEVKVIHAGLECGILGAKYPNWDMISFGPTIRNPHSPDEMVSITTVQMFWDFLVATLKNIPRK